MQTVETVGGMHGGRDTSLKRGVNENSDFTLSFFTGGSFHAGANKIRAKFGDIRCRKSEPDGAISRRRKGAGENGENGGNYKFEI